MLINYTIMKINAIVAFLILSTGFIASAQQTGQESRQVMLESLSQYGFEQTVEKLSSAITAKGWKITITHDLQETMKKNGREVLPVKIIEMCNPGLAYQILSKDELRDVSPMLPCRISVYEKSDGKTYLGRMNAPAFASMIGGEAEATVLKAFEEAEGFVNEVTN